jgi:hypothetical protein
VRAELWRYPRFFARPDLGGCCRFLPTGGATEPHVQQRVDDDERQAPLAEGLDPDDAAVVAAIDLVRWELSLWAGET